MQDSPYTSRDYFHRDLSWLLFNKRVIQEAKDEKNPLIERLRFLAIASNNADEFFMIRVPGIQSLARMSGEKVDSRTGWTQEEILEKLFAIQTENVSEQYTLYQSLLSNLANMGYETVAYQELSDTAKEKMTAYFQEMILPSLTPIALDAYHAFPKIVEKKAHLLVRVKDGDREERAIIPLPALFPRYIQVEGMKQVILIEDLIEQHLAQLFVGWKIVHSFVFRITYDKDLAFEEDTEENLFIQMEEYIQERSKGLPSRLEISELQDRQSVDIAFLTHMLELKDRDIYSIPGPLDLTYLFSYLEELSKEGIDAVFPVFRPYVNQQWLGTKLYETLDKQDVLIQHPYDSYESVVSFIETAARDPHTIAIKQTLYRMAKNSRIVEALKSAARAGKQVTALVELKARFDEENNLHWVQELEEAGCYVTYGLMHLKTHSKATLVVKKNGNQLQQYVHIGTGNYNESTAKIYADFSLFSSHTSYVEDVTAFFNYLSGYRERPDYQKIAVSPEGIRQMLIEKISATADYYEKTKTGSIFFKMNSLTDRVIIQSLYEASQKGVPIHLLIRGACCLRPGIPDKSETIEVKSIVGRFLEHSRVYSFVTDHEEYWLSSADAMTRNMMLRVEIAAPIEEAKAKQKMADIVQIYQKDDYKSYYLQNDGTYQRKVSTSFFSAQATFVANAIEQQAIQPKKYPESQENRPTWVKRIRHLWKK